MGRLAVVSLAALTVGMVGVARAQQQPLFGIPVDTVVYGDPGSVKVISTQAVGAGLVGEECAVFGDAENNDSVHPNSDLIISSNGDFVLIPDVERLGNGHTDANGTLTLGPQLTISVRLGPDGVFSGGLTVTIACATSVPRVPRGVPTPAPGAGTAPAQGGTEPAAVSTSSAVAAQPVTSTPRFTG
jgi:hypothetical protein